MATALPEHPDLDQLRTQARELQRAVRAGDPQALGRAGLAAADRAFPLSRAQLALARRYGFASWARLRRHVEAIAARSWRRPTVSPGETPADRFLRAACLTFDRRRPDARRPRRPATAGRSAGDRSWPRRPRRRGGRRRRRGLRGTAGRRRRRRGGRPASTAGHR